MKIIDFLVCNIIECMKCTHKVTKSTNIILINLNLLYMKSLIITLFYVSSVRQK